MKRMFKTWQEYNKAKGLLAFPDATVYDMAVALERAIELIEAMRPAIKLAHPFATGGVMPWEAPPHVRKLWYAHSILPEWLWNRDPRE